jgi:hypothetical protein
MKLLILQFLRLPVAPVLLSTNILCTILFSKSVSLCSSVNERKREIDQVSDQCKTIGKIEFLY